MPPRPARTQRQQGASGLGVAGIPSTRDATRAPPGTIALSAARPSASNESSARSTKPAFRMPAPDAWFSGAYAIQNRSASSDSARAMASSRRG
jgi:hypothetical protein